MQKIVCLGRGVYDGGDGALRWCAVLGFHSPLDTLERWLQLGRFRGATGC